MHTTIHANTYPHWLKTCVLAKQLAKQVLIARIGTGSTLAALNRALRFAQAGEEQGQPSGAVSGTAEGWSKEDRKERRLDQNCASSCVNVDSLSFLARVAKVSIREVHVTAACTHQGSNTSLPRLDEPLSYHDSSIKTVRRRESKLRGWALPGQTKCFRQLPSQGLSTNIESALQTWHKSRD